MIGLQDDDLKLDVIRMSTEGYSYRKISEHIGVPASTITDFLKQRTYKDWWQSNEANPIVLGDIEDHHSDIKKFNNKRYIITSCQNNTYVHYKFLQSLETCAKHLDAKIIVGTFSYNKSAFQNLEKGQGDWFDPKIKDYIIDEPVLLADDLIYLGELNILPTAVNPLSGLQSYAKGKSAIVPHAKVQLESLPTHKSQPVRMMYTTGAISRRNYVQKKAGQKASFHHIFGALLVEIDSDGDWFVRQLIADSDTGEFQDLDCIYTPHGVISNQPVEAVNWGDIHTEKLDLIIADCSFYSEESILNILRPKYQFIHDVLDMSARNHHSISDPYFRFKVYRENCDSVYTDVASVASFLDSISKPYSQVIVVESNHDLALKRWLKEADYKTDPENAIFFLKSQLAIYEAMDRGNYKFSILEHWIKDHHKVDVKFLTTDESFKICPDKEGGIECGCHGHLGSSGSRGSVQSFTRFESRYNIGHTHSAAIKDGVYSAGVTAKLDMGYNQGHSTWSNSHIITYPNSKRSIVTIKNGKWRA